MLIREASPADVPQTADLITLAYRVEDFFIDGDRTDAADVRARMERGTFLLLEDERGLAGAVFVEVRGRVGYFGMLSVDPGRQGQGIGSRLVEEAEDWCRRAECALMEIEVVSLRTELPPFYERRGYTPAGSRAFPDGHKSRLPCEFLVMTKPL